MRLHHQLEKWALDDPLFPKHMSFIVGPRQCGKTTLALQFLQEQRLEKERFYFNWDRFDVRRRFRDDIDWIGDLCPPGKGSTKNKPLLIFDEIHKGRQWKRILKGIYDTYAEDFRFVVTGSGRLDHFQKGSDSLAGRYDLYSLFPFTPGEVDGRTGEEKLSIDSLLSLNPVSDSLVETWENCGGFPEPFLSGKEAKASHWWKQYKTRVTEEDLRDLTRLESVDLMRNIIEGLPARIGSPLSLQSIREDVETSFATVKRYISTLNQLYLIFEVPPYSKKIHRPIKKEKKIYFFHHAAVSDPGARFENMVALVLKRWASEQTERARGEHEIYYLRDQDRREVDFLLTVGGKPALLFEVKRSDTQISPSLRYYSEKLGIQGMQIVRIPGVKRKHTTNLGVLSFHSLAAGLG